MDDENCSTGEYVGETGIGGEQSRRERIVINKVLNNDEWARGISLASEQQQRSWEYCIQLRGSDSLQPRPLGETLVTFYNHTLRRQDETGDGLRRRSKPDSDSKNDCDENVEQEVIVRRSSPLDNGESHPKAETARRQNENEIKNKKFTDNPVPSQPPHDIPDGSPPPQTVLYMDLMGHSPSKPKGSDDDLSIREPLTPCRHGFLKTEGSEVSLEPLIDNPEAVTVEVKFNRNSTFLTGVVYYPNDVPPKQLVSQHYLRLTYPPGEFLFVTIPCLGQETSPSVRLRKKPLLSPGDSCTQGKLVGKPSAHHTIDDVTDKPSSDSSINLLEYKFRSGSETPAFERLRGALGVRAAGEQTVVHQAWFMVFDDEAIATFRSGQPGNLAPLPQKLKILGAYHELIHLIGDTMSLSETKILDKFFKRVSDIELLAQIRNDKVPTQANFENELVLEMEAISFELQAIINVVDAQIQILRSLARFQLGKTPEKSVAVRNMVKVMVVRGMITVIVGDRRFFSGEIGLILSKLRDLRQRLDAMERRRTMSQQQSLATAFAAQVASSEIAKVLEETNKCVESQRVTWLFTLITTVFFPIGFLTLYWGIFSHYALSPVDRNERGSGGGMDCFTNPISEIYHINLSLKRMQVWYCKLSISFAILVLLVVRATLALQRMICGQSKRVPWENTKASKEIAKVSEETNKHTESSDFGLFIFTVITVILTPTCFQILYWGINFYGITTTNWEQVGFWGLCVLALTLVLFVVWAWAFGRVTSENLRHPLPPDPKLAIQQSKRNNNERSLHSADTKSPRRSSDPGASWFEDTMWRLKHMISRLEFSIMRASRRRSETLPIRVSWKCSCGTVMFDDFSELVEGGSWSAIPSTSHAKQHSSISRTRRLLLNLRLPSFAKFAFGKKTAVPIGLPNSEVQISNSSSSTRTDNLTTNNKYLLLCYNNRWDSIRLLHLDVPPSRKDQEIFAHIRHAYYTARGWWRCLFSLKVLRRIEFVKFELYYVEDVDICARNDLPGPMVKQYEYIPRPAETIPPIGPNTFMHFFHNPDHAPTFNHLLNRMPKKLDGRVTIEVDASTEFGWGIHFVEELSRIRIFVMSFAILSICSIFAILWTIIKGDIQGGFGVAGFLAAALAVFISIVCVQIMVY